jgi:hypothetical protein
MDRVRQALINQPQGEDMAVRENMLSIISPGQMCNARHRRLIDEQQLNCKKSDWLHVPFLLDDHRAGVA